MSANRCYVIFGAAEGAAHAVQVELAVPLGSDAGLADHQVDFGEDLVASSLDLVVICEQRGGGSINNGSHVHGLAQLAFGILVFLADGTSLEGADIGQGLPELTGVADVLRLGHRQMHHQTEHKYFDQIHLHMQRKTM